MKGMPVSEFIVHGCVVKAYLETLHNEESLVSIDIGTTLFYMRTVYGMHPFECHKLLQSDPERFQPYAEKVASIAMGIFMKIMPFLKTNATVKVRTSAELIFKIS